jgi:hypothetical protein
MNPFYTFDIETGADPVRARALMPIFDEAEVKLGNIKDEEKRAAKIEEKKASHESNWIEKACLRPETGQLLAIGILAENEVILHTHQNDEVQTINAFWDFFRSRREDGKLWVGPQHFSLRPSVSCHPQPDSLAPCSGQAAAQPLVQPHAFL